MLAHNTVIPALWLFVCDVSDYCFWVFLHTSHNVSFSGHSKLLYWLCPMFL